MGVIFFGDLVVNSGGQKARCLNKTNEFGHLVSALTGQSARGAVRFPRSSADNQSRAHKGWNEKCSFSGKCDFGTVLCDGCSMPTSRKRGSAIDHGQVDDVPSNYGRGTSDGSCDID